MEDKYYSIQEVAHALNVAYLTVYRWIKCGKLPAYQIEKQYRLKKSELEFFLKNCKKN